MRSCRVECADRSCALNSIDTAKVVGVELRGNGEGQDGYPCASMIQRIKTEAVLG